MADKPMIPHSHVPFGPDGSGFYSDNTKGCYLVIQESMPLMLKAVEEMIGINPNEAFCIADYGTADGGTSLPLMIKCIEKIRSKHGDGIPITIIYEDQPTNDFKSIFFRVNGLIPETKGLLESFPNLFVMACGTGFYSQCLPASSVNLGFAATCMHWLSEKPCDITNGLHHTMIQDDNEKILFKNQAAKDWKTILTHRAKEIKQGGYMVIVQFTIDHEGQYLGHTKLTKNCMFSTMTELWKGMMNEGLLTKEEFKRTTFLNYYRTIEELSEPFNDPASEITKAGLKLCQLETKVVKCPYNQKWKEQGGDPQKHAEWFVPTTRTWSNHTFYSALSGTRSETERRQIVDELFLRYAKRVSESPSDHGMDYVHAYLLIKKE